MQHGWIIGIEFQRFGIQTFCQSKIVGQAVLQANVENRQVASGRVERECASMLWLVRLVGNLPAHHVGGGEVSGYGVIMFGFETVGVAQR